MVIKYVVTHIAYLGLVCARGLVEMLRKVTALNFQYNFHQEGGDVMEAVQEETEYRTSGKVIAHGILPSRAQEKQRSVRMFFPSRACIGDQSL